MDEPNTIKTAVEQNYKLFHDFISQSLGLGSCASELLCGPRFGVWYSICLLLVSCVSYNPFFFYRKPPPESFSLYQKDIKRILRSTGRFTLQVVGFWSTGDGGSAARCVRHPYPTHCWIWFVASGSHGFLLRNATVRPPIEGDYSPT